MLAIRSGNRYSVVLSFLIQYSSGEDTFSGRESPPVIISYSNTGGGAGRPLSLGCENLENFENCVQPDPHCLQN